MKLRAEILIESNKKFKIFKAFSFNNKPKPEQFQYASIAKLFVKLIF